MNQEIRKKTARSLCTIKCIGSPGHHEQCYFPVAYVVGGKHTFFRHIAEQYCIEYGVPESAIETMTIYDAWLEHRRELMPKREQAKINEGIESQCVDSHISEKMRNQWAHEREDKKAKNQIQEQEE